MSRYPCPRGGCSRSLRGGAARWLHYVSEHGSVPKGVEWWKDEDGEACWRVATAGERLAAKRLAQKKKLKEEQAKVMLKMSDGKLGGRRDTMGSSAEVWKTKERELQAE